jgi:hypothetical protein
MQAYVGWVTGNVHGWWDTPMKVLQNSIKPETSLDDIQWKTRYENFSVGPALGSVSFAHCAVTYEAILSDAIRPCQMLNLTLHKPIVAQKRWRKI